MSSSNNPGSSLTMTGERLSLGLAAAAALLAASTLAGYATGTDRLVRLLPDWQGMSVSTALLCLALAVSLASDALERIRLLRMLGASTVAFSGALLVGHAVAGHDVVSPLLVSASGAAFRGSQTSMATALCAGLLGVGCIGRPRPQPALGLAIAVMLVTAIAILGYAYGVQDLYALSPFRTMSLQTAIALFLLGLGFLLSNRQAGVAALALDRGVAGQTTRRQLGFLLFPPVAAYVLLIATSASRMGPSAAMALLVVLTVAPLAALILKDAKSISRLEVERRAKRRLDRAKLLIERRYRALFNGLETGFCVIQVAIDAAGKPSDYRFIEVNPAFARQTGLTDAEGKWMRQLAPDHERHWFEIYGRVALTGEPAHFEREAGALGRYFDVSAFRVDEPEEHHVAVLFTDISQRRRAELDLKALNATLERRVAERAAALDEAHEALRQSQKMEAIGQLTGGVAHDFNNLLTVIRSSVDLLKRPNLTEERRLRYIGAISDTATRATKLTGQLLAFARRQSLKPEVFDLAESIRTTSDMISTLTGSRIRIEVSVPEIACFVNADASQFDTSLVNLAINARDAMGSEGTLTICVGTAFEIPPLHAQPAMEGDFVTVSITDTGVGIAPENFERIFEPFYTTKGVGQGTGLGLSQVIGFVKQSGGDVAVQSELGNGTTFTLYLPRVSETGQVVRTEGDHSVVDGHGISVLVVEDNADVGSFATMSLAELGYTTVLAVDAQQAFIELAKGADRFDVVFSDVVMPGMNGIELGQEIRRLYADLPVVLTSGYSHVLAQNGTYGFELLHKPYSIEQLSRILAKVARWRKSKRPAA